MFERPTTFCCNNNIICFNQVMDSNWNIANSIIITTESCREWENWQIYHNLVIFLLLITSRPITKWWISHFSHSLSSYATCAFSYPQQISRGFGWLYIPSKFVPLSTLIYMRKLQSGLSDTQYIYIPTTHIIFNIDYNSNRMK